MSDATELAWAAGFWDGEGCTSVRGSGILRLNITQRHIEVLERFQKAVGIGKVYGPYQVGGLPRWEWKSQRQPDIYKVMALLWPYLSSVKKQQMTEKAAQAALIRGI